MAAKAASPEGTEQVLQRLESQEIDGLIRDFKSRLGAVLWLTELPARRSLWRRRHLRRLLGIDEAFIGQAFGELVKQILYRLIIHGLGIVQHVAQLITHRAVRQQVAFLQRSQDRFT